MTLILSAVLLLLGMAALKGRVYLKKKALTAYLNTPTSQTIYEKNNHPEYPKTKIELPTREGYLISVHKDQHKLFLYHNNKLIRSHIRLSQEAIPITIAINPSEPHHELVMVAENLGSIPPNTSVMVINTPHNRYEVFISSNTQKNAKVVFDLKK